MKEPELLHELARRTSLPESEAASILKELREMLGEGIIDEKVLAPPPPPPPVDPEDPGLVEQLIARAKKHPLGIEFLLSGFLASVAIGLGAHAFTVEAARRRLRKEQEAHEAEHEKELEPA